MTVSTRPRSTAARACAWLRAVLLLVGMLAPLGARPAPLLAQEALDFDLPDGAGHFYKQANGQGGAGETGFAITNANDVRFWNEYRRLGGPDVLGYPASRRFIWEGFTVQVVQKAVLQWRPDTQAVAFANVLDRLHALGKDDWLLAFRQIPRPFDNAAEAGLSWDEIIARRWGFLDTNEAIKARYFGAPAPLDHFGLPVSYADLGDSFVLRAQRAAFQYWKRDVPWAAAGEVTVVNAGDLAKEAGVLPGPALAPELPPGAVRPVTPPCQVTPVRGFGEIWSDHPEAFALLDCPSYPPQEQATQTVLQRFERGWMVWARTPATAPPQVYALFEDNQTFAAFPDTWTPDQPAAGGFDPPPGLYEPERGFGKVWREGTGAKVRERLGWATEPERGGQGAWQAFRRRRMVWEADPRLVFLPAEASEAFEPLHAQPVPGLEHLGRGPQVDLEPVHLPGRQQLGWPRRLLERVAIARAEDAVADRQRAAVGPHVAQPHHPVGVPRRRGRVEHRRHRPGDSEVALQHVGGVGEHAAFDRPVVPGAELRVEQQTRHRVLWIIGEAIGGLGGVRRREGESAAVQRRRPFPSLRSRAGAALPRLRR